MTGTDIDFGSGYSGHFIGWHPDRALNPQYDGVPDVERAMLLLTCPHGEGGVPLGHPGHAVYGESNSHVWKVESWEPLTHSPSIHRLDCGSHGFIRNGQWQAA